MYYFLNLPFQTRKSEDFYFWSLALYLQKLGYFYINKGKILVFKIAKYTNKGRYSTSKVKIFAPKLNEIQNVLNIDLPIKLKPNMSHLDLARLYSKQFKYTSIWVYDKGKPLNNSPFINWKSALLAMGYAKTSIAARRSIDTAKIIKGRYTLYSKPLY
jgi:hypothetical protein